MNKKPLIYSLIFILLFSFAYALPPDWCVHLSGGWWCITNSTKNVTITNNLTNNLTDNITNNLTNNITNNFNYYTYYNATGVSPYLYGSNNISLNDTYLNSTIINICSAYNDTSLINAVNTTLNIRSLGFNTTTQLNNVYYPRNTNPSGFISSYTESDPIWSGVSSQYNTIINDGIQDLALVNTVGNWSNDKVNYNNITADYTNDSLSWYSISNPKNYINSTNITITCSDEQYLATDLNGKLVCNFLELYHHPYYYKMTDLESVTAVYNTPWVLGAIASGTAPLIASESYHPGIVQFTSSTTASSGYTYNIAGATTYLLVPNMTTEAVFRPYIMKITNATANYSNNLTNIKMGFMDVFTGADAVDGVYWNITQFNTSNTSLTVSLIGSNNSARVTNTSIVNLSNNTWYTSIIVINSITGPGLATGYIKDASGNILINLTVSLVPSITGRETSQQILGWISGGTTAVKLVDFDFTSVGMIGKLQR